MDIDWTHLSTMKTLLMNINNAFNDASKEVVSNGVYDINGKSSYIISVETFDKLANAIKNIK